MAPVRAFTDGYMNYLYWRKNKEYPNMTAGRTRINGWL